MTASGFSFAFTSAIVRFAHDTISSKRMPLQIFSFSQLGMAGVSMPMTHTLIPFFFLMV